MKAEPTEVPRTTLRLQQLLGRRVVSADGRHIGRVVECLAEADGEELRVEGLLVGPRAWSGRFGSASGHTGRLVRWEEIATLVPYIALRSRAD